MDHLYPLLRRAAIGASLLLLGACAGLSTQDRNTAIGAGAGAVLGSALSNGSAAGTIGGAAVGGYVGRKVHPN
ncbi:MAG: glycine zipper 2TM domain-containing protein [Pseudomonadota bacterium]